MNEVTVKHKEVYGKALFYPVNNNAKLITELTGRKTLTNHDLKVAGKLGFIIGIQDVFTTQDAVNLFCQHKSPTI